MTEGQALKYKKKKRRSADAPSIKKVLVKKNQLWDEQKRAGPKRKTLYRSQRSSGDYV